MVWKVLPQKVLLIGFFLIVGITAAFYLILGVRTKSLVTSRLLTRQQLFVRAEATNITSFFQAFGDSIAVLSQLKTITSPTSSIWTSDVFVEQWRRSGVVDGIALTDRFGVLKLNSNITRVESANISLADRDYFIWATNEAQEGEYYLGKPVISRLGASKDKLIVPVASPVIQDGEFMGVLVAAVEVQKLTENYLELIKVSDNTEVYLLDSDGKQMYTTSGNDLPDDLKGILSETKDGSKGTSSHIVAYTPISLGSQNWFLIMASPVKEVASFAVPIYARILILVLIVTISMFAFGVIAVREVKSKGGGETPQNKLSG